MYKQGRIGCACGSCWQPRLKFGCRQVSSIVLSLAWNILLINKRTSFFSPIFNKELLQYLFCFQSFSREKLQESKKLSCVLYKTHTEEHLSVIQYPGNTKPPNSKPADYANLQQQRYGVKCHTFSSYHCGYKAQHTKPKATPTRRQGRSISWKCIWNMSWHFYCNNSGATK